MDKRKPRPRQKKSKPFRKNSSDNRDYSGDKHRAKIKGYSEFASRSPKSEYSENSERRPRSNYSPRSEGSQDRPRYNSRSEGKSFSEGKPRSGSFSQGKPRSGSYSEGRSFSKGKPRSGSYSEGRSFSKGKSFSKYKPKGYSKFRDPSEPIEEREGPNKRRSRFRDDYKPKSEFSDQTYKKQRNFSKYTKEGNYPKYRDRTKNKEVDLIEITRTAMLKYGFTPDFPNQVLKKSDKLDDKVIETKGLVDLTNLLWSSIDNIDTEDLDQIEYCEREKGLIHIKVAIADVDSYVPKDSMLDLHAQKNTTSVYTGVQIYPMLPDNLSKDLTSLPVNHNRLAVVTEFTVLPGGQVKSGKIYGAIVRNKAKLVYEQVGAWLENKGPAPEAIETSEELKQQILLQHEASQRLGKFRAEEGALNLETLHTKAVVENNRVLGLYIVEEDPAKHIIENFMIGANAVMSQTLEKSGRPTIQRVVKQPKYWDEIVDFANKNNYKLPHKPDAQALSRFLDIEREKNPKTFSDLSLTIVKLLGPGEYVLYDNRVSIGHFCMAITSYTHSTAPNRRYPDLIIQRLIKSLLKGTKSPYTKEELHALANRCTELEHAAKKVERFVTKAEGAVLLSSHLGETFDAMVTGASSKGEYARLIEPPVEGKIMNGPHKIKVGDAIRVKLINLDPYNGYIDFALQD